MSILIDNLIAWRILRMLVTPFTETEAFRLGIIDAKGKTLRKPSTLKTTEERENYSYLHRLVFNIKKILLRLPGGDSKFKNIVAALWLVKESYEKKDKTTFMMEEKLVSLIEKLDSGLSLVEEEIMLNKFLAEEGITVANVAGAAVSTDVPAPLKKDIKKYKSIARRSKPTEA
jgi:hypothetical protein